MTLWLHPEESKLVGWVQVAHYWLCPLGQAHLFKLKSIDSNQFWDMKVKKLKGIKNKGPGRALLTLPSRPSPPLTTFHNCPRRDGIEKLETSFRLSSMEKEKCQKNWMKLNIVLPFMYLNEFEYCFSFLFLTTSFPYWHVVVLSRFDFTGKPWGNSFAKPFW